jgi:hypothetical protein
VSKYASRKADNLVDLAKARRKATTKAFNDPNRKQGFARVPENMFIHFGRGAADRLLLVLLMRSGLVTTGRNGGWIALPQAALQQIALADRWRRGNAVHSLVARGVLETRKASPGAALEYRLRPVDQWQTKS